MIFRLHRRSLVVISACLLTAAGTGSTANGSTAQWHNGAPLPAILSAATTAGKAAITGVVASPLAAPHPVLGADGRRHLAYELQVINASGASATISAVKVIDAATGRVLSTLGAAELAVAMTPFGAAPGATLGGGSAGFILMDTALPANMQVPERLVHDMTVSYKPNQGLPAQERTGITRVAREAPVVLGAPLTGARWIAFNGCCGASPHRLAVNPINGAFHVSERFAIDFARLNAAGRGVEGNPQDNSSYPSYGARVIAVVGGVVVGTKDGIADNVPVGSLPPLSLDTVGGNYVVVAIGDGHFAFYAHLKPHTLAVRIGQHVSRGQLLGRLGNSGNSDFPHLHFHVMDTPSPLSSNGLPFEFRSFGSAGTLANVDDVFAGGSARFDPTLSGRHIRQLPLDLQSVNFAAENDLN